MNSDCIDHLEEIERKEPCKLELYDRTEYVTPAVAKLKEFLGKALSQ